MGSVGEKWCDLQELEEAAKARLRVLHRLDATYLTRGDNHEWLDRIAAGLFARPARAVGSDDEAAAAAAADRAERLSVAAVRLAFCSHAAARRWLVHQEGLLYAARLRLGERPLPDRIDDAGPHGSGSGGDRCPMPPLVPGHRWVTFERALELVGRRQVAVNAGWAAVPERLMSHVAVADQSAALARELVAAARRLEHMRATPDAAGSPGLHSLLARLATYRPARDGTLGASSSGFNPESGPAGGGAPTPIERAERGVGEGQRRGWRRGWREERRRIERAEGAGGGGAAGAPSSLPTHAAAAAAEAARPALGVQSAFGRLPAGPFFTKLGPDAKRVMRVLRKGPGSASARAAVRPFPLCMRRHLTALHANRHLRHHARHQLTLFFKGVDMSADEALAVWRAQIAHGRMADFQREHTYHVRHAYGLEGKMADYPPHTCERLAKAHEAGEGPGCPFAGVAGGGGGRVGAGSVMARDGQTDGKGGRSRAALELRVALGELVAPVEVEDIAAAAEAGAPRAACARLFAALHGDPRAGANVEGEEARRRTEEDEDEAGGGGECACGTGGGGARSDRPLVEAVAHLKFPHDYYDASVEMEERCRSAAAGGTHAVRGGGAATSRPHVTLELEEDSSDDEDAYL